MIRHSLTDHTAMSNTASDTASPRRPLRLWPGEALLIIVLFVRFVLPIISPDLMIVGVLGSVLGALLVFVWWTFFSRAAWIERVMALALVVLSILGTRPLLEKSIAGGAMGMLYPILAIPLVGMAFVIWAVATRRLSDPVRRVTMAVTIVAAAGFWALVRTGGFTGNFGNDFAWRWTPTPEDRLLAQERDDPKPPAPAPAPAEPAAAVPAPVPAGTESTAAATSVPASSTAASTSAVKPAVAGATAGKPMEAPTATPVARVRTPEWPGFRGSGRDSIIRGVRIDTDWSAKPPVAIWRRPIGPGWSSFAVSDGLLYTQEQRGEDEVVAAYKAATGEPVWRHRDKARFWESNGGAGPRGTPTLSGGRVYTLGATGRVNALDAASGAVVWSRDAAADTGAKEPTWGFSGSPLVLDEQVIVAASGSLVSYQRASGEPRWKGPTSGASYSSPQLMTIGGVPQVLLLSSKGLTSVAPADGAKLWSHEWSGYPIVQPAQTAEGDVLIAINESSGTRRLAAVQGANGWTVEERWTSNGLKPYFNDFVVHQGHAYGFDGRILACIDLKDGARKWKGGRYGGGQLVLLPDQNLLLVLSEEGELALVSATTDQFKEIARAPALEGKTWNHPVLIGDTLFVRNDHEMAAFRLSAAPGNP
jgi:outer membrane protein assembly factor BamB